MSYLEEVKNAVEYKKEELVEEYKQFMDDFIIKEFVDSTDNTATITESELRDCNINTKNFITWLQNAGFSVESTREKNTTYIISYE